MRIKYGLELFFVVNGRYATIHDSKYGIAYAL